MEKPFLVMYHGAIMSGRGIEMLIKLTARNPHILAVILGNGNRNYLAALNEMVVNLDVKERVLFHPAVPINELGKYIGAVDVSLMTIEGKVKSYYFALPNKFFESIQAMTPIIASNFPEMENLINHYQIGLTCDPDNLEAINDCVEKMRTDTEFYNRCKTNLKIAKDALCWENEKELLIKAFNEHIMQ